MIMIQIMIIIITSGTLTDNGYNVVEYSNVAAKVNRCR